MTAGVVRRPQLRVWEKDHGGCLVARKISGGDEAGSGLRWEASGRIECLVSVSPGPLPVMDGFGSWKLHPCHHQVPRVPLSRSPALATGTSATKRSPCPSKSPPRHPPRHNSPLRTHPPQRGPLRQHRSPPGRASRKAEELTTCRLVSLPKQHQGIPVSFISSRGSHHEAQSPSVRSWTPGSSILQHREPSQRGGLPSTGTQVLKPNKDSACNITAVTFAPVLPRRLPGDAIRRPPRENDEYLLPGRFSVHCFWNPMTWTQGIHWIRDVFASRAHDRSPETLFPCGGAGLATCVVGWTYVLTSSGYHELSARPVPVGPDCHQGHPWTPLACPAPRTPETPALVPASQVHSRSSRRQPTRQPSGQPSSYLSIRRVWVQQHAPGLSMGSRTGRATMGL